MLARRRYAGEIVASPLAEDNGIDGRGLRWHIVALLAGIWPASKISLKCRGGNIIFIYRARLFDDVAIKWQAFLDRMAYTCRYSGVLTPWWRRPVSKVRSPCQYP